jgi:hypothetical protein
MATVAKAKRNLHAAYIEKEYGWMVGRTIKVVRPLIQQEIDAYLWSGSEVPFAIFFDDGSWVVPMSDDEGNGAGALDYSGRGMFE